MSQSSLQRPKAIGTLHQLGNFWRMKGNPRKAIECFRKALSVSPHNPDILLSLAKVLFHLQYLDDAIYLTRRSLEVVPSEHSPWQQYYTLGEIFKAYGHYYEASVHFRHTLDLYPDYEPALKLMKELEDRPISPWQPYTYFIIGLLVLGVLVFINWDLRTGKSQKHFSKNANKFCWSGRKCRKLGT